MKLVARLLCLGFAALAACKFDPAGAHYIDPGFDASLPDHDGAVADADGLPDGPIVPPPPDARVIDAALADATEIPPGCGDGVVEPPEQCDDHGTTSGDGCSAACRWEPGACFPGAQMAALVPGVNQSGTTTGQSSGLAGGGNCGGGTSGEDVFTFELSEPADVIVSTALPGTNFNTSVYVRSDCNDPASQLGCAAQAAQGDILSLPDLEPGSYFAVVDGFATASGNYEVRLSVRPIRALGAACDPFGEASRCAMGLVCEATDATGHGVCVEAPSACVAGATTVTLGAATANVQHGATSGMSAYSPRCAATGTGPEKIYRAVVGAGAARDLVLDVQSTGTLNPVAELTSQCEQSMSSLSCSAASSGPGTSELAVINEVAPGEYFAVVDGFAGTSGGYDADFYLRPVLAAGASCDRHVRANRCGGASVCVDGNDLDATPTCTTGVPVLTEGTNDNSSCNSADGPRSADFVYSAQIAGGDIDVVELTPPPLTSRIVASVYGPGGTCPVDLALTLDSGDCGQMAQVATSNDEGIGSCPYIDATVPLAANLSYWLTITRSAAFGTGSYTMVVDFIP